jgi:hypothetical protein
MEVEHGGLQGAMAQVLLDQTEVDPGFEQMGCVGMSESVDRDPLLDAELQDQLPQGGIDTGGCHRSRGGAGQFAVVS